MKPSLTSTIVNGELQHVLVVGGEKFESFSCRRAAMAALATALTLSGCATLERHPIATAIVVGIVAGSIAASTSDRTTPAGMQPSICNTKPESCR